MDWGSLPLAAHDVSPNFCDFSIQEDLDYDITQQAEYQTLGQAFEDVMNEIEMDAHLPYTESNHTELQHEQQQYSGEMQPGAEPVSMQNNPNLVDNDIYTTFCGVYSPEKLSPVRNSRNTDSPYHCPRYDNKLAARNNVKERFPHCITKDGNPDALRWNGHTSLKPLCNGEMRDKARCDRFRDSLEAWSGVAIPSKLSWGQVIVKFVSSVRVSSARRGNHLCAVCGGGTFSKIDHVKSHFIGCVKRYGNPKGANWYDRLDPKHIKKHLPGRPDATVYAPPTIASSYAPVMPLGDQGSHPAAAYTSTPINYVPAMSQEYQSSLSEYPPIPLDYTPIMNHGDQPPFPGEYPPIPFGYTPAYPQESRSYPPTEHQ